MSEKCATKSCGAVETEITQDDMRKVIMEKFNPVHCEVDDLGTCGTSYQVIIVSDIFEGKKTLEKHKIVNEALSEQIARLHAFSQKSYTPAQWEKKQGQAS
ncbi:Oidioi.mRNA.OKI2018_I69.PAR.g11931.t1.cds [Oikopleura dioica]|uniref:Oidioi.mRNA.OKI2018_I69.PAR.g11931.t1.cds n=1 Tax=Oikopleura dioica TaxID=34765 RepID=A0ABN7S3K5_OIKDI|nr:Oidioi.mRNA.OKI2018_I69.PAR.g11931.t1.cds [Oikopleura dioica]